MESFTALTPTWARSFGPLEKRTVARRGEGAGAGSRRRCAERPSSASLGKGAEVSILNRTPQTAQKLAREAKAKSIRREVVAKTNFDVIVNATSVGMHGVKPHHILEPKEINARLVFDMVYNPVDTPLLKMARQKSIAGGHRGRDVRTAGSPAIRNLDGKTGTRRGNAARRGARPAPTVPQPLLNGQPA